MSNSDIKSRALNTSHDYYDFLAIPDDASDSDIRRAYRKTALKYHSDRVGTDQEALEHWNVLQQAHEILLSTELRQIYDNARLARQQKASREEAYDGRRKQMKEELERRERAAGKRKRTESEEQFDEQIRLLAADGKRRREERDEQLRKAAEQAQQEATNVATKERPDPHVSGEPPDYSRTITFWFPLNNDTRHITAAVLQQRFERFGDIAEVLLRHKKRRVDGKKHRQDYKLAFVFFRSIASARDAITDFGKIAAAEPDEFGMFESIGWANKGEHNSRRAPLTAEESARPTVELKSPPMKGAVPSLRSFKPPIKDTLPGLGRPTLDSLLMARMKNVQKRREEEKIGKGMATVELTEPDPVRSI